MIEPVRRLSEEGMRAFGAWIRAGAPGAVPAIFLSDPTVAVVGAETIDLDDRRFESRFAFGEYLTRLLSGIDPYALSYDRGLWSWLAARYFEQLCFRESAGSRKLRPEYSYVLSENFRHYYRHLVRTPWYVVKTHSNNARFLLASTQSSDPAPLSRHSELLEQLGSRQAILGSPSLIAAASQIYSDATTGRPLPGTSSKGRGSPRRLRDIANQLALTFDTRDMLPNELIGLLPKEFSRWRGNINTNSQQVRA
jgi:hypothetical protein